MNNINDLIKSSLNLANNKSVKLSLASSNDTKNLDLDSVRIYGGLNGWGKWSNYFKSLSNFVRNIEQDGNFIYPTNSYYDAADDIFNFDFKIKPMSLKQSLLSKKFSDVQ